MKYDENRRAVEFDGFPTLETKRLVLREITFDDAEFWIRNFSDPDVVEMTAFEGPKDVDTAKAEIQTFCTDIFKTNTGTRWSIALKGSRELIGTAGYHRWMKAGGYHATTDYDLLREHRRQGITKSALTEIVGYSFKEMRLHRFRF